MPGSGKSTYGVVLAKRLGYKFVDTDLVIQEKYNKLLWEIIDEEGLDSFLKKEEEANMSINCENTVIAPGGSVIYGAGAMEHFRDTFIEGKADAALAASVFHFGEISIPDLKKYLRSEGINVRI